MTSRLEDEWPETRMTSNVGLWTDLNLLIFQGPFPATLAPISFLATLKGAKIFSRRHVPEYAPSHE
jgi:hypothetical protein